MKDLRGHKNVMAVELAETKDGQIGMPRTRFLVFTLSVIAALALLIATIGAVLAMITGHIRWIELAWLSIAASLLAIVVSEIWPWDRKEER